MANENIALRWTEERSRLGFSQADISRKVGVTRETMRKYENALTVVSTSVLATAFSFGFDVQYIVTGVRALELKDEMETPQPPPIATIGTVSGVGVAAGNSTVNITTTEKHITHTHAEVNPGSDHISDEQAAALHKLVSDIVQKEETLKKKPATYRAVWGALNSFCKVPKYRLIPHSDFGKARNYLDQWMGRLDSLASAPVKDGDNWRKRHYAYIKINSKDELTKQALKNYMSRNFNAVSLTELDNAQLEAVYKYVAGRKNKRSPKR